MNSYINFFILFFLVVMCSENSESIQTEKLQNLNDNNTEQNQNSNDDDSEQNQNPNENNNEYLNSFKKIVSDNYDSKNFNFGATLNYHQFSSNVEALFLKEFNYLVSENSFKQSIVHP